jgi:hypothetical protein
MWLEDVANGRGTDDPMLVREVTLTFESLQMECLPVADSRDLIGRVAEKTWKGIAPIGVRALTAATTAQNV